MKKIRLTAGLMTALLGGTLAMDTAEAVHLNGNGVGQVLVYPYYTVNSQQQSVLSVVNSSNVAKSVKVRFREAHNGRALLEFDLFLSPYDVWTGTIFSLADAGLAGEGAAITTQDRSCTLPMFSEGDGTLPSGAPYVAFRDFAYLTPDDGGPYGIDRTREGHLEIIALADLSGFLAAAVKHNAAGVPANCAWIRNIILPTAETLPPSTGLYGAAIISDAQDGTYFSYNAEALENFTSGKALYANNGDTRFPDLSDVNDGTGTLALQATALVVTPAGATLSTYPGTDKRSRPIDAVSAVFAAENLLNEYLVTSSVLAATDWVVTFPTKSFYVDRAVSGEAMAIPPFVQTYDGQAAVGPSCVTVGPRIYDREERTFSINAQFPGMPQTPPTRFCRQTNVLSFLNVPNYNVPDTSGVLGSRLITNIRPSTFAAGWLQLSLDPTAEPHALLPATNGNVHRGLPAIGFAATVTTNNPIALNNDLSLSLKDTGTSRHRSTGRCTNGTAGTCN